MDYAFFIRKILDICLGMYIITLTVDVKSVILFRLYVYYRSWRRDEKVGVTGLVQWLVW